MGPNGESRYRQVRSCLLESNCTADELSEILHWKKREVHVILSGLIEIGHAKSDRRIPTDKGPRKLYILTPRGVYFASREKWPLFRGRSQGIKV